MVDAWMPEIKFFDHLNNTPAMKLATMGLLDTIKAGLGEEVFNLSYDHKAVVAFSSLGESIGVITYFITDWKTELFIQQSYVLPKWRRMGIYDAMWKAVLEKARDAKVKYIRSITHGNNKAMRAAVAKQGRIEECVVLTYTMKEEPTDGDRKS